MSARARPGPTRRKSRVDSVRYGLSRSCPRIATSAARSAKDLARAADRLSVAEERVILAGVSAMAAVAGQTQIHTGTLCLAASRGRPVCSSRSVVLAGDRAARRFDALAT